jgi:hypothetical protein
VKLHNAVSGVCAHGAQCRVSDCVVGMCAARRRASGVRVAVRQVGQHVAAVSRDKCVGRVSRQCGKHHGNAARGAGRRAVGRVSRHQLLQRRTSGDHHVGLARVCAQSSQGCRDARGARCGAGGGRQVQQPPQRHAAVQLQLLVLHALREHRNDSADCVLRRSAGRQGRDFDQVSAAHRLLVKAAVSVAQRAQLRHQRRRVHRRHLRGASRHMCVCASLQRPAGFAARLPTARLLPARLPRVHVQRSRSGAARFPAPRCADSYSSAAAAAGGRRARARALVVARSPSRALGGGEQARAAAAKWRGTRAATAQGRGVRREGEDEGRLRDPVVTKPSMRRPAQPTVRKWRENCTARQPASRRVRTRNPRARAVRGGGAARVGRMHKTRSSHTCSRAARPRRVTRLRTRAGISAARRHAEFQAQRRPCTWRANDTRKRKRPLRWRQHDA